MVLGAGGFAGLYQPGVLQAGYERVVLLLFIYRERAAAPYEAKESSPA